MKKLFVLIVCLFLAVGCGHYTTPVRENKDEPTTELFTRIEKFEFEGHKYIWFRSLNGGYAGWDGGIVHDPDCECMIDYD